MAAICLIGAIYTVIGGAIAYTLTKVIMIYMIVHWFQVIKDTLILTNELMLVFIIINIVMDAINFDDIEDDNAYY